MVSASFQRSSYSLSLNYSVTSEQKITSSYWWQIGYMHVEHVMCITHLHRHMLLSLWGHSRWENTSLICLIAVNMSGYYSCSLNAHFTCFCTQQAKTQRMAERYKPIKCEWMQIGKREPRCSRQSCSCSFMKTVDTLLDSEKEAETKSKREQFEQGSDHVRMLRQMVSQMTAVSRENTG